MKHHVERTGRWLSERPSRSASLACALSALTFLIDLQVPQGLPGGAPYVLIMLLVWYVRDLRIGIALAALCSGLLVVGSPMSPQSALPEQEIVIRAVTIVGVWISLGLVIHMRRTHDRLKHQEDLFREYAEIASDWFWVTDRDNRFVNVPDEQVVHAGLDRVNVIGKRREDFALVAPEDEHAWAEYHRCIAARQPFRSFEYRYRDRAGLIRFVSVSGNPIFDDEGEFQGYRGAATDRTAYMMTVMAARENRDRLVTFAHASSDWYWEMDKDLRFTAFSGHIFESLGIDVDTHIGLTRQEVAAEKADDEVWKRHFEDLEAHRPFEDFRYYLEIPDGEPVLISTSGRPIFDSDGVFTGYRGSGRDISHRVETEEQNRRLAAAIEAISGVVALYGPDDRLVIGNARFRALNAQIPEVNEVGYPFEEYIGRLVAEGLVPSAEGREEAWIAERMERHRHPSGPFEMLRQDGQWLMVHEEHLADGSTILFSVDIRDLKRAEAEREQALIQEEQASQVKSEFLATMSHEFRTPLNAVIGFSEMMKLDQRAPLTDKQESYLNSILDGGRHLLNLVNEILDLDLIEADQFVPNLEEVDAKQLIEECIDLARPLGVDRGISIELKAFLSDWRHLRTDAVRFKQVLINLLSNSVKFNADHGTVTVDAVRLDTGYLRISISDTGIGIAAHDQAKVFEKFHRFGVDATRAREGAGIGLSVTKLLVERMGGRVGFESELGVGSTFWFELPESIDVEISDDPQIARM